MTARHDLRINGDRLWSSLMTHARIGALDNGGICREALTTADRDGRDLFGVWCRAAGLDVAYDQLGNMFATRAGTDARRPPIACGSHLDTQPCGGKFDGILGVLAGLEIARTLQDAGIQIAHPLTVINWTAEEGSRFSPSMAGSGVYAGIFPRSAAERWTDRDGTGFIEALRAIGYEGSEPVGLRTFRAYLELHIEQGPLLEARNTSIGIVTGSQDMRCYAITIVGAEAHAGTTPMDVRLDPVSAFTRIFSACETYARSISDARCTVGAINVEPGSHSVIPRELSFLIDLRHPNNNQLLKMLSVLRSALEAERARGHAITCNETWSSPAIAFDADCVSAVRQAADVCGYSAGDIVSGAGHDAVYVARVCPTAMIFTPCKDGISHNAAESITPEDAERGANVLLQAILHLDKTYEQQERTS